MATEVFKDVPKEKVKELRKQFESVGCKVTEEKQDNGLYTVTAICPDN
jgi:uncharacterized protein with GYD domain